MKRAAIIRLIPSLVGAFVLSMCFAAMRDERIAREYAEWKRRQTKSGRGTTRSASSS